MVMTQKKESINWIRWGRAHLGLTALFFIWLGIMIGLMLAFGVMHVRQERLVDTLSADQANLTDVRRHSQDEINALARRLSELQAQATRLNALGQRLTEMGKLKDGEFNFQSQVGVGDGESSQPATDLSPKELKQSLLQLEQAFSLSNQQLDVLATLIFDHQLEENTLPVRAPIQSYVTSNFGYRIDPFTGRRTVHSGVDFHAEKGDPIAAVADGIVSFAGRRGGYGQLIEIDHHNGFVTRYAHNARLLVHVGDLVRSGQTIASAGSSGRSTGPHVHFEVWFNGKVMDPMRFLAKKNRVNVAHGTLLSRIRPVSPEQASPKLQ